ncbi:bifunctional oligoribonuclease/PAP phosphatase NrnA [Mycoplasma sp. 'Moose RK']|uniref:DHH family phosphoesterase n=1 Tax=Mycoplasma sp. 'Moose RK' TaxID=2780095 RepID=UPI0018C2AC6A|nr:bifunctional oligoribonuclease/PAP phosphatase NrnA [Mycoplasma sp. 'Moose RK']MBG0730515.1 bifunctional oligoribonuclease/PAP phosphatase NrnA [Mycoplasma sp. 'Moose RK']
MTEKPYLKIIENIEKHSNIFIFHHIRPDGDCLGAQQGLGLAIQKKYRDKRVFLIGNNQKVFDFLNFHFDDENSIASEFFENSLAITVDTASLKRIEKVDFFLDPRIKTRIKIDHHPEISESIFQESWVDTTFSAASEMIGFLIQSENWQIDSKIAELIYLGILTDSGRFAFVSTSPRTFLVAAFLLKANFDFAKLNWMLAKRSEKEVAFCANVLGNYQKKGKFLWYFVTKDEQEKFQLTREQTSSVNILANIGDARIWAFFIADENGKIRVRLRSNGPVVNKIATEYGGGGHAFAAGINLENDGKVAEIIEKLAILANKFEKNETF